VSEGTCKTCPFWDASPADRGDAAERECRVRSPAAWSVPHREAAPARDAMWPWTRADDWCGEHPARQRDRLAAMAMQGMLADPACIESGWVATAAYLFADAMLKAREPKP
jgi:hypothetical protein